MSQNDKLLEALCRGEVLTPLSALHIAGTLRLSERIRELESENVQIARQWLKVNGKRVMSYKLGVAYG